MNARDTGRARRRAWPRLVPAIILAGLALWFGGLLWFVTDIPRDTAAMDRIAADAAVVLTGGSGRMQAGLALLDRGRVRSLFVTGVDPGVDIATLMPGGAAQYYACCVELGHAADDTRGNAMETATWAARRGHDRLLLVTANYHMPRSLLEFGRAMPDVDIIPFPVQPAHVKLDRWWRWPGTARLLIGEYNKYLVALLRGLWPAPGAPPRR